MKCPHCGKQISDFAITCPNCGGNPKGQATEEVKSKAKVIVEKTDSQTDKMLLIGAGVAFAFSVLYGTIITMPNINKLVDCIIYVIAAAIAITIGKKYDAFKVIIKNIAFYVISVVVAIADFMLQDVSFKARFGSNVLNLMKENMMPVWVIYMLSKILHIVVLVVGIALLIAFFVRKKKTENK